MGALCIVKSQQEFNKYIIEELSKVIKQIQEINNRVEYLENLSTDCDFWFEDLKKEMEIDK